MLKLESRVVWSMTRHWGVKEHHLALQIGSSAIESIGSSLNSQVLHSNGWRNWILVLISLETVITKLISLPQIFKPSDLTQNYYKLKHCSYFNNIQSMLISESQRRLIEKRKLIVVLVSQLQHLLKGWTSWMGENYSVLALSNMAELVSVLPLFEALINMLMQVLVIWK